MITVVVPTYNRAHYLKEAIDSVLKQTYRDIEIIVVDDESRDNTPQVVAGYKEPKIRYLFQKNKERGAARNNGIRNARGEYIAFLDSDDVWLPDHLASCLQAMRENQEAGLSFSGSYLMGEDGRILSRLHGARSDGWVLKRLVCDYSSGGCNASSCLIRKTVFDKAGYFNEEKALSGSEDWEMWARIAAYTRFISTNACTVKIRFHPQRSSLNVDSMAASMTKSLDILYRDQDIYPRIKPFQKRAYSSLYVVIATNYYSTGEMRAARGYLGRAAVAYPLCVIMNRYMVYTFLRSLLGAKISFALRKHARWLRAQWYNAKEK